MERSRDLDPVETQEWLESLDWRAGGRGPGTGALPARAGDRGGAQARARQSRSSANTAYVNTIPVEQAGAASRATARSSTASARLIRWNADGDRAAGQQGIAPNSAATSRASSPRRRSTTSASCISGTRPTEQHGGDLVYFQGHSLARHLRPRLPRRAAHRGAAAQLPPGGRTARASPPTRIPG